MQERKDLFMPNTTILFQLINHSFYPTLNLQDHGTYVDMVALKESKHKEKDVHYILISLACPSLSLSLLDQRTTIRCIIANPNSLIVFAFVDAIIDNQWDRAKLFAQHMLNESNSLHTTYNMSHQ